MNIIPIDHGHMDISNQMATMVVVVVVATTPTTDDNEPHFDVMPMVVGRIHFLHVDPLHEMNRSSHSDTNYHVYI